MLKNEDYRTECKRALVDDGLGLHNVNLKKGLITAYGGWIGSSGSYAPVI